MKKLFDSKLNNLLNPNLSVSSRSQVYIRMLQFIKALTQHLNKKQILVTGGNITHLNQLSTRLTLNTDELIVYIGIENELHYQHDLVPIVGDTISDYLTLYGHNKPFVHIAIQHLNNQAMISTLDVIQNVNIFEEPL